MRTRLFAAAVLFAGFAVSQTSPNSPPPPAPAQSRKQTSAGRDIGSGAGDIGKGTAKGAVSAVGGTGKAALDLVTLHPINAAADLGKGAAGAGKNVGYGAVKGAAKIGKGAGKAIRHLF